MLAGNNRGSQENLLSDYNRDPGVPNGYNSCLPNTWQFNTRCWDSAGPDKIENKTIFQRGSKWWVRTWSSSTMAKILKEIYAFRQTIIIIVLPLIASILPIVYRDGPSKGGFVVIVMAGYWMTESLPLAVTAILPVILFPMLGVQESDDVCRNYLKDTNFLFVGGLIMAIAIETWNLHRRIALRILLLVGSEPRWLMLGFMICTGFLSMWISNTATTAMMIPIAQAVLNEILKQRALARKKTFTNESFEICEDTEYIKSENHSQKISIPTEMDNTKEELADVVTTSVDDISLTADGVEAGNNEEEQSDEVKVDFTDLCPEDKALSKALLLCIPYAANVGGTATITGTGPNLVGQSVIDDLYGNDANVTFATWLAYCLPGMIILQILAWLWLQFLFIGFRGCGKECGECFRCRCNSGEESKAAQLVIKKQYDELGPITWAEGAVFGHFLLLVLLWLFREPSFIPGFGGWSVIFPEPEYITDATAAIFVSFLLYVFPSEVPNFLCCRRKDDDSPVGPRKALLDWKITQKKMAWNIVFLLGGGFALADGCEKSGLSAWMGEKFESLDSIPPWTLLLIITVIIALFTEFSSNVSTASIFAPILAQLAEALCINPLYLVIPSILACSLAFMLPVATPPNAIAFSYGQLSIPDMAKAGAMMNIIGILVVNLMMNTYGIVIYDARQFPEWAADENSTCLEGPTFSPITAGMYTTPSNGTCVC
ncbi:solute carrier family 13 member 5-like [Anneissia japonica]|uniref:solute carrier family 13 member 5-like n=1 Tax=Anneissia japonica TaxID=1529436 RepID=UPI001425712C|nr:solute carrier family 13 member 5-like [Anneissia japonica]